MVTSECASKVCLVSWNVISTIVGATLCVAGMLVKFGPSYIKWFTEKTLPLMEEVASKSITEAKLFDSVSIGFICVGVALAALGVIGMFIAYRLTLCLVVFYGASIVLSMVAQLTLAGLFFAYEFQLRDQVEPTLLRLLPVENVSVPIVSAWQSMQHLQSCCGATGYSDYSGSINSSSQVPSSCCSERDPCRISDIHPQGCVPKILAKLENYDLIVGVIVGAVFVVEILLLVLTIMVFQMKEDEKEDERVRMETLGRAHTLDRLGNTLDEQRATLHHLSTIDRMKGYGYADMARSLDRMNGMNNPGRLNRLNAAYEARSLDRLDRRPPPSQGSMDRLDEIMRGAQTMGRDRSTGHM